MSEIVLDCKLSREEIITRVSLLSEIHIRALMSTMDENEFEEMAVFPVEIISTTVNGYQRFLTETTAASVQKTAGFILRLKAALLYEFGKGVVEALEREHISLPKTDLNKLEGGDVNFLTLWVVANPTLRDLSPPSRFDVFTTYLFLNHVKWLVIRLESENTNKTEEKK